MSNLSYMSFGEESVLNFYPIYTIQYKLVKSMVYCGLRTSGVLFPWPQLVFSLGFYTYQAVIWRSIHTAGSADSPFQLLSDLAWLALTL